MGSEYDKLKKLMSEDNGPVPPELNWERMEEGILQKMEELQSGESSSSNRGRRIRTGLIVAILLLLLLGLFLCTGTKNEKTPALLRNQAATEQSGLPERPSEDKAGLQPPSSPDIPGRDPASADSGQEEDTGSPLTPDRGQTSSRPEGAASPSKNGRVPSDRSDVQNKKQVELTEDKPLESSFAADSSTTEIDDSIRSEQIAAPIVESDTQALSDDLLGSAASADQKESVLSIPVVLLPAKEFVVAKEPETVNLPARFQVAPMSEPDQKQAAASSGRIALLGGISWWAMGYGAAQPERHPYERTIASYQAQLNYLHTFKKNYTLLTGLQVHQLENRFDWSAPLDDYTVTLTDTILQIRTNSLTGQQAEVRGDVEVNVPAVRTVRHYNQTRIYQIPLALGKTWTFKKWQADVLLGGSLNILSQNKGRTLYLGDIQDYDGAATDFLNPQWNLHGLFMGRLSYRISDHFGITTGIQFQKSLTNWSTEANIKMYPTILSWELGVNYQLN